MWERECGNGNVGMRMWAWECWNGNVGMGMWEWEWECGNGNVGMGMWEWEWIGMQFECNQIGFGKDLLRNWNGLRMYYIELE